MTGHEIIGELMRADSAVTTFATAVKAGRLPDGTKLPAYLVRTVSVVERQTLKRTGWERMTARIAVTVRASSYDDQVKGMKLLRKCCAGRTGDIGGGKSVSILTAGMGPDVSGPANSFEQTQDFRVSFDAPV